MISIIVACSENLAIGYKGNMPWHLAGDLKYFRSITTGHTVIMGRKTYESIGKPLPNRHNIIITRDANYTIPSDVISAMKEGTSVEICLSLDEALQKAGEEAIVMGGAQIYNQAWDKADKFYITRVHTTIEQFDASVPDIPEGFKLISSEKHFADEKNDFDYTFEVYVSYTPNL
ncbi:MAG: dihydrofolate reductase [Bacteroidales bacterium]|nr:dihydrofolate reductase [Bacteroidales bacterium]